LVAPDESPPTSGTVEICFGEWIDRADIPSLCADAGERMAAAGADRLVCDVGSVLFPDAVTVEALARLKLTARRQGGEMCLRDASRELLDLVYLMGLSDAVAVSPRSRRGRGRRQSEEREQRGRVEEEDDPADPAG
jgi:anti-anti-sigma regulatory factor